METDQKPVIWTIVIATIIMLVAVGIGIGSFSSNVGNKLDVMNANLEGLDIDEQAIANAIVAGMPDAPIYPEFPEYMISEEDHEDNLIEAEAERLALAELDSKDFRLALKDAINLKTLATNPALPNTNEQKGLEIISYKDIEDVYSIDVEDVKIVTVDEREVTIEFKVKYVLDDDEDLVGKARVTVVYDVLDLVVDDDFEDAEVDEAFDVDSIYLYSNLI